MVRGMKRTCVAAAIVLTAAGCRDSGLPDRNLPLEEAEQRALHYSLYEAAPAGAIVHDGAEWVVAGLPMKISAGLLVPIDVEGGEAFALATDAAPHDRLYVRSGEGWIPLARALPVASAAH